jgi:GR25 family glycosyltransferase involved in LPS biosynthesis
MRIDQYFDKVYMLNLHKRPERLALAKKRMAFCEIEHEVFGATDGSVMRKVWESFYEKNQYFTNPSYLGCAISHLAIYRDALERGYKRILIVEDDNRIRMNANSHFSDAISRVPEDWNNLLYLGFIPLTDDCSQWNYGVFGFLNNNVAQANNFWGLFGYGIHEDLMKETLETYDTEFPMELDRFFVTRIQPRGTSYGITPQIFAADDGVSDNSGRNETGMLERSTDSRFSRLTDYI